MSLFRPQRRGRAEPGSALAWNWAQPVSPVSMIWYVVFILTLAGKVGVKLLLVSVTVTGVVAFAAAVIPEVAPEPRSSSSPFPKPFRYTRP